MRRVLRVLAWIVGLLLVLGISYIGWLYWRTHASVELENAEVVQSPPPVLPPPAAPSTEQPPLAPPISHPIVAEEAPVVASTTVDSSDDVFTRFVTSLFRTTSLPDFIYSDRMLRRFVATVDNLPRKELALRLRPVKPPEGRFLTEDPGGILNIAAENEARYERYVRALESIDIAAAVKFYATHYALFQKAYQDLGYPKGNFNDRLFEAIDDMLATPQVAPPVFLVQPKVQYRYADPDLENRSAGQKTLLRMGAGNSARVKAVLSKVRAELGRYDRRH